MNEIPKVVFSNSLKSADWGETTIAAGDLTEAVTWLKQERSSGYLLAHGGARFARSLVETGLIDEYRLAIHPVILGAVDVEYAADDRPVFAAGDSVAGEHDLVAGKVERDAARCVAGNGHRHGTVAETDFVSVSDLAVDPRRDDRFRPELAHDLLVDGPFPVGQVRRRPGRCSADERRVGVVGEHFHLAPVSDGCRGPDLVGVEVRQGVASKVL
jgi:hypothetical protein